MTIKKAYKIATTIIGYTPEEVEEAKAILLKSLDRLEQLEKENQKLKEDIEGLQELNEFNCKSVQCWEHNYGLLEKENKELRNEIISLELDTCIPELRKEITKLKQAIRILKAHTGAGVYHTKKSCYYELSFGYQKVLITKEKYELLKEMFSDD